jgi:dihydroorotate dehydrogenase (NAD+) catalytic subunit
MANLKVNFLGVEFKNPVLTASGTYGFGMEYNELYDIGKLGGIMVKGLTLNERQGNPAPRIWETKGGILNSVGLQNPGVKYFAKNIMPMLKKFDTKIIANVSGSSFSEYKEACIIVDGSGADIIELNVSCPNVKEGGVAFGTSEKSIFEITSLIKKNIKIPLVVKLSPNVTDISAMALAAARGGADGISLINTLTGMAINIDTKKPVFNNVVAGLSGDCVKPVAVRMVHQVYQRTRMPIIGMGGISSWEDAVEFMIAGSSLVSIGTANFKNPFAPIEIIDGIEKYLDKNKIKDVADLIGSIVL